MSLMRLTATTILTALLAVATASAECVLPKAPGAIPNGTSATSAQMDAARLALERYQKAIKDYLVCKEQETKIRIAELGTKVDAIRQVKLMEEKRSTGLQEELQRRADEFDDQLRAYKLINRE